MRCSNPWPLLLAFGMAAFVWAPLVHTQEVNKPPRRVDGVQLREWISDDSAFAGIDHGNHCVFLITGPTKRRVQYVSCPDGTTVTVIGVTRIDGDMNCTAFEGLRREKNVCREWHQVGENKFLLRSQGATVFSHTVYKLR